MTAGDAGPLSDPVLSRLEALGRQLDGIAASIGTIASRERKTRRITIGLAISLVLDIVLTVVIALLSVNAITMADALHTSQLASCQIGNDTRSEQLVLWNYILNLAAASPHADETELGQFRAFVTTTFAPVNCARLYPG